ncbi:hypothetical protein Goklo_029139, partial [Gossypium klotzschianum]|nr:hypothetical protein [Gossypium klotzschianum]
MNLIEVTWVVDFHCQRNVAMVKDHKEAQDEEDKGNGIAFIWKIAMMGYGCGTVLGISMAYIVFTTGIPQWL